MHPDHPDFAEWRLRLRLWVGGVIGVAAVVVTALMVMRTVAGEPQPAAPPAVAAAPVTPAQSTRDFADYERENAARTKARLASDAAKYEAATAEAPRPAPALPDQR